MGKIEIRRNAGSFVLDPRGDAIASHLRGIAPMDQTFLAHLVDVRAAVEDRVVTLVARNGSELDDIASLLEVLEEELDEGDGEAGSLDLRFEAGLARLASNPLVAELQRAVHQLWVEAWSACGIPPGDRRQLHKEHVAIYHSLRDGDESLARRRMAEHVDRMVPSATEKGEV